MIKISVIVPVYNVENYLKRCLDSIINQTLKDIEIICVDDCSPDNSIAILEEYKNKDNRIKIVRHNINRGLGFTRNTGIKNAMGEYISFIDSDDYIDKNFLFYLYSTAKKYDSDVTNTLNIKKDFDGKLEDHIYFTKIKDNKELFKDNISSPSIIDEKMNTIEYLYMVSWNKIYKKSFLLENNLYFMDIISGAEDEDFYKRLLICEPKISYNHNAVYYYRQRQGSIMNIIKEDQIKLLPNSINTISLMNNSVNYCKIKNPNLLPYIYFKCFQLILLRFNKFSDNKLKSEFYNHIKNFSENIDLDEEITPKYIYNEYLKIKTSINFENYIIMKLTDEINEYKTEINKYKTEINKYKTEINKYKTINTKINIADILFSITYDNDYLFLRIFGLKITIKKKTIDIDKFLNNQSKKYKLKIDNILCSKNYKILIQEDNLRRYESHYYVKFLFNTELSPFNPKNFDTKNNIDIIIIHGMNSLEIFIGYFKSKFVLIKEDGFIRSATTWVNRNAPIKYRYAISFTFDVIPYFYAKNRTIMEYMLNNVKNIIDSDKINRSKECIKKIIDNKISKYNHQPIYRPNIGNENRKKVLVIDQSYGDKSIEYGMADNNTFKLMLEKAIEENPNYDIIIKTHPDALAQNTKRKMTYYTMDDVKENVYLLTEEINPISLLEIAEKVYVCTSQFGFEALMMGKEVHTFGMPFYAGWGVTIDYQKCKRRKMKRTVEEIFYIAYIMYTYYVNPDTEKRCEIEEAIDYLIKLRKEYFAEYNVRCDEKSLIE